MNAGKGNGEICYSVEKECCVLCGRMTGILKDGAVTGRKYYIEGAGQLCQECYQEVYVPRHNGNKVQLMENCITGKRFL